MRTFIAIPLDDVVHKELAGLQDRLRSSGADVKWVDPSNIHLTLKFLGKIDEEGLEKIRAALPKALRGHKPFTIHLAGVGAFPKLSHARVIWVGVDEGCDELKGLAASGAEAMEEIGFEKEKRPFSPHLTLGRVRSAKNNAQLVSCAEKDKDFTSKDSVPVKRIILFQSTLTPKGPTYKPLCDLTL